MLKTKLRRTPLILLAIVLMLSVFSMTAFAEEALPQDGVLLAPADETVGEADDADVADVADEGDKADETEEVTDKSGTSDATTDNGKADATTGEGETTTEKKGLGTSDIVSLIILAIVVIAVVAYCIVKREKVGAFFRSIKSEFKKIVWSPWNQVRKNTIVVLAVVISLAIVIGLADLIFMKGITALSVLF